MTVVGGQCVGDGRDERQGVALVVAAQAVAQVAAPREVVGRLPLGREIGIGYRRMTQVFIDLHALGTHGHRAQTIFKLADDIVRKEERIALHADGQPTATQPLGRCVQLDGRFVAQVRIADVVVLVERVVEVITVGLGHGGSAAAPTCAQGDVPVGGLPGVGRRYAADGLDVGIRHVREEDLQRVITLFVIQTLPLLSDLGRNANCLVVANGNVVARGQTGAERADVGPCDHIHRSGAAWVHRHVGKDAVVVDVVVQLGFVTTAIGRNQTIQTRRPALAGHVHVDGDGGALRVVHDVGDVVVVNLCLPVFYESISPLVAVGERGDDALGLRNVHVQRGVADIGRAVVDGCGLDDVTLAGAEADIGKGIDLLKLREIDLVAIARAVVVGVAVEGAEVAVEAVGGDGGIGPIDLQMTIGLVSG